MHVGCIRKHPYMFVLHYATDNFTLYVAWLYIRILLFQVDGIRRAVPSSHSLPAEAWRRWNRMISSASYSTSPLYPRECNISLFSFCFFFLKESSNLNGDGGNKISGKGRVIRYIFVNKYKSTGQISSLSDRLWPETFSKRCIFYGIGSQIVSKSKLEIGHVLKDKLREKVITCANLWKYMVYILGTKIKNQQYMYIESQSWQWWAKSPVIRSLSG